MRDLLSHKKEEATLKAIIENGEFVCRVRKNDSTDLELYHGTDGEVYVVENSGGFADYLNAISWHKLSKNYKEIFERQPWKQH